MTKTACVALAASLILPLLASHAAPRGPHESADDVTGPPGAGETGPPVAGESGRGGLHARLPPPDVFAALSLEEQRALVEEIAEAERAAGKLVGVFSSVPVSELPGGVCLASGEPGESLCAAARRISHQQPCLASSGDCPALDEWRRVMGEPGVRPAPEWTVQAVQRSGFQVERPGVEPAEHRRSERQD